MAHHREMLTKIRHVGARIEVECPADAIFSRTAVSWITDKRLCS